MSYIYPKKGTCYIANVGSGKTMLMCYYHALPALVAGVKVVSDFHINFKGDNLSYFKPEEFDDLCLSWRNCILLIDEIGVILDSRQYKDEGSNTRKFFQYHRKHHVEVVCSTQHISQVAKTVKNICTDFVICEQIFDSPFAKGFLSIFNWSGVVFKTEVVELIDLVSADGSLSPDAPILFGSAQRAKTHWLRLDKLVRSDLDDVKSELTYKGCSDCRTRFTDRDLSDTKNYSICPLCMTDTITDIEAIMYDTDFELPDRVDDDVVVLRYRKQTTTKLVPCS